MDGMPFLSRVSLSWTTFNRTMGAGVGIGLLEEDLEVELPPEEEDEEDEEDLFIFKARKMTKEGITFGKYEREDRLFEPFQRRRE